MSLPAAMPPMGMIAPQMAAINPIEYAFMSLNTNPWFIGMMMLLLNLGGRFIGLEMSKEQEKFFQRPWIRRALIFTVLFVATRNVFVAAIMTVIVLVVVSFLFNENSDLCIWKTCKDGKEPQEMPMMGLTPEESEILKRLSEKQARMMGQMQAMKKEKENAPLTKESPQRTYYENIERLQS